MSEINKTQKRPYGNRYCKCGCGKYVNESEKRNGMIFWKDYISGHEGRKRKRNRNYYINKPKRKHNKNILISTELYHDRAWKMFGSKKCDHCNMTLEEHLKKYNCRFHMHCVSIPKDYSILIPENWKCLCLECHLKEENIENNHNLEYMYKIHEFPDDYDVLKEL
jgi:hypothetical protein